MSYWEPAARQMIFKRVLIAQHFDVDLQSCGKHKLNFDQHWRAFMQHECEPKRCCDLLISRWSEHFRFGFEPKPISRPCRPELQKADVLNECVVKTQVLLKPKVTNEPNSN